MQEDGSLRNGGRALRVGEACESGQEDHKEEEGRGRTRGTC